LVCMWNSSQAERRHDVTGRSGVVATGIRNSAAARRNGRRGLEIHVSMVRFRPWTPIFSASYESARRMSKALVTIQ
jgi:hypothetical protein